MEIHLPPLRERRGDIPLLSRHFLKTFSDGTARRLTQASMEKMETYDWPGNVRQLAHAVERGCLLANGDTIDIDPFSGASGNEPWAKGGAAPKPPSFSLFLVDELDGALSSARLQIERAFLTGLMERATDVSAASRRSGIPTDRLEEMLASHDLIAPKSAETSEPASSSSGSLKSEIDDLERTRIIGALERCGGNQTAAAELLGISRRTLVSRLRTYNIARPRRPS